MKFVKFSIKSTLIIEKFAFRGKKYYIFESHFRPLGLADFFATLRGFFGLHSVFLRFDEDFLVAFFKKSINLRGVIFTLMRFRLPSLSGHFLAPL